MEKTNPSPPKFFLRFFRWFCHPDLRKHIEGDLVELYGEKLTTSGKRKADWKFVIDVLLLFKPGIIKPFQGFNRLNHYGMFKNYFKVGIRNLLKYRVFSLINVFGLAVAMSVCMLIILMLADQKSYDQFHSKKDRIYRILSDEQHSKAPNAVTAFPLASALKTDYSIVEESTHLIKGVGGDAIYDQKVFETNGYFTDVSFFKVFDYELEKGDRLTALAAPNSMVITNRYAQQLFKHEDPIGKTVELVNRGGGQDSAPISWGLYTVTGVIEDKNHRSHLKFDVLVSSSSIQSLYRANKISDFTNSWQDYRCYTYALLFPERSSQDLTTALNDLVSSKYTGPDIPEGFKLVGQKLGKITPGIVVRNPPSESLPVIAYYFLFFLALVIMVSACLNYTNLSVARALTRAKEIGIRKVTGAFRRDLVYQFLSESVITALLAFVIALLILTIIKPAFRGLWINQHLNFDLNGNLMVYFIFVGLALLIGLSAGFYPSFYLSKRHPIQTLNNLDHRPGKLGIRKALSVSQFVISLIFITTSILIFKQFRHFIKFNYGFNAENVVNIALQGNDYQLVANALGSVSGVSSISASDYVPATGTNNTRKLKLQDSDGEYKKLNILLADENFTANLEIELLAGRNLTATDSLDRFVLVNEAALKAFGYEFPSEIIGKVLESNLGDETLEVIGVVENFCVKVPVSEDQVSPMLLRNRPFDFKYANVKIVSVNIKETIAQLEQHWKNIDAAHPFKYRFYDDELRANYQWLMDVVSIVGFIAFLAISIACLGLLGMATYTATRKRKEVGIRKIFGAESFSIAFLLSGEFLRVLMIAVLIAAPLSYFLNNFWLQHLPNRVDFGFGTVFLATAILLALGSFTIGSQTVRASKDNLVDTLRMD